jgi:3-oxoacyl-[acyl-carrier protein] reductase
VHLFDFTGKTVVVTGASRGLGEAISKGFADRGAYVFLCCQHSQELAEESLDRIKDRGGDGAIIPFDLRDKKDIKKGFAKIHSMKQNIDTLINNAAITRDDYFPQMELSSWDEVLQVNTFGTLHCVRECLHMMSASKSPSIVNISSISADLGQAGQVNYSVSKGALQGFTRELALELASTGIRVNAVVPGLLSAGMGARLSHTIRDRIISTSALKRVGLAEEVANAVLFLSSGAASYITGQCLAVDGGLLI